MRTYGFSWACIFGILGFASGCSSAANDDSSGAAVSADDASAILEIHPLDIWAQAIPDSDLKLTVSRDGETVTNGTGVTQVFLKDAATYAIHVEAPNHVPLDMNVYFAGGADAEGATIKPEEATGHGIALGHTTTTVAGHKLTAHELYLGLRHKWFSAEGRPARRGNAVKLMMDGEEAWSTVHDDLVKSTKDVMVSTWWWESNFEIVRTTDIGMSSDDRWNNTIFGTLEKLPSMKRVLIGEFLGETSITGIVDSVTDDSQIRAYAAAPNDNFEMMQQGNDTKGKFRFDIPAFDFSARVKNADDKAPDFEVHPLVASTVPGHDVDLTQMPLDLGALDLASIHQKFMVVDDETAYVGGMNLRHVDWDSSQHLIYDARREEFGAWDSSRTAVQNKTKKPDTSPRKDYMVRVDGPSAQDVADVFHERWNYLRGINARYSNNSSAFDVDRDVAPRDGGIQLQVTTTMPQPFWEHGIAETWFNAVNNAQNYIYIEDQYFRVPMLNDAIAARMDANPDLQLVVVTINVNTVAPECIQTAKSSEFFQQRYPDRFSLFTLRSFDSDTTEFGDMDIHSKMLIVDDQFMSVGSANKNNRGIIYEAEMTVAVADPIVAQWRQRIAQNMLGTDQDMSDPDTWIGALKDSATANDAVYTAQGQGGAPQGFVYHLTFPASSSCVMQSVGPDET